jgi:hypothetical protein
MYKLLVPLVSITFLAGCAANADGKKISYNTVHNNTAIDYKFDRLSKSCSLDRQQQLKSADAVMAVIVNRINSGDTDPNLYTAGTRLYKLVGKFYRNSISSQKCLKEVEIIRDYYVLSHKSS